MPILCGFEQMITDGPCCELCGLDLEHLEIMVKIEHLTTPAFCCDDDGLRRECGVPYDVPLEEIS